jgi:hypothetical protein
VLRIKGPCCTCACCADVEFQVLSKDGEVEVGKISKKWSGLIKEYFTDADNFGISMPIDLDVKIKAVVLGALFLIVSSLLLIVFMQILIVFFRILCSLRTMKATNK